MSDGGQGPYGPIASILPTIERHYFLLHYAGLELNVGTFFLGRLGAPGPLSKDLAAGLKSFFLNSLCARRQRTSEFRSLEGTNCRFPSLASCEGPNSGCSMEDYRPRSSYESDNVPWSKAAAHRSVRATVGQELWTRYKFPRDLPSGMLWLLARLNEREEGE